MGLLGEGAVAIWHDIAPEGRDEFYAWHGEEHMPERLGVRGFLRSARYAAVDHAKPEFLILHEVENFAALSGADYLASLNHPTPRTLAVSKHLRNATRSLCRVAASFGGAKAGLLASFRYDVANDAEKHGIMVTNEIMPALTSSPAVSGAHFLLGDVEASNVDTAEKRARGGNTAAPGFVLLVESWGDIGMLRRLCDGHLSDSLRQPGVVGLEYGVYRLQTTLSKPNVS
jgi:hypothetical protein